MTTSTTTPTRLNARRGASSYSTSFDKTTLARLAAIGQAISTVGTRTSITAILRHAVALYCERLIKLAPHALAQEAISLRKASDGYSRTSPDAEGARLAKAYAKFNAPDEGQS